MLINAPGSLHLAGSFGGESSDQARQASKSTTAPSFAKGAILAVPAALCSLWLSPQRLRLFYKCRLRLGAREAPPTTAYSRSLPAACARQWLHCFHSQQSQSDWRAVGRRTEAVRRYAGAQLGFDAAGVYLTAVVAASSAKRSAS